MRAMVFLLILARLLFYLGMIAQNNDNVIPVPVT